MDSRLLHVIWDCSGSMGEMGKHCVAADLVACLGQAARDHEGTPLFPHLRVALWGAGEVVFADPPAAPLSITPEGTASIAELLVALDREQAACAPAPLNALLLTDGGFPPEEALLLRTWLRKNASIRMRAVAMGPDARLPVLEALFGRREVHAPQDALEAARGRPSRAESPPPFSRAEILWPAPAAPIPPAAGDDDDWS